MAREGNLFLVLLVIVVVGLLWYNAQPKAVAPVPTSPAPSGLITAGGCPSTGYTVLKVAARNPLNASLDYEPVGMVVTGKDGRPLTTVTGGESGLGNGSNVACGSIVDLYVVNSADYAGVKYSDIEMSGAEIGKYFDIPKSSELQWQVLDNVNSYVYNTTEVGTWVKDNTSKTIAFSAGEIQTYTIRLKPENSASQYGSDQVTNYICADFNTAKFSKTDGVILGGLAVSEIPSGASSDNMDKCWVLPAIKSNAGYKEITVTIKADLGEPGSSDDIKFKVYDGAYYTKIDGTIGSGAFDDALNAIGETDTYFVFDFS